MNQQPDESKKAIPFFFFFLGLTNLMFNWGHHTYIVPASPAVKTVAYVISMTELLILGHIIFRWRKTLTHAQKNFHLLPYRLFSFADGWIFLNLTVAILISIPALNYYTHGTHITVAHTMGTTIGINTMLLFGCIFYIVQQQRPEAFEKLRRLAGKGMMLTNLSLVIFWSALLGLGFVKISSKLNNEAFAVMMKKSEPLFKLFTLSGMFILVGIVVAIFATIKMIRQESDAMRPTLTVGDSFKWLRLRVHQKQQSKKTG